ncbi:MAG: DNA helicase [Patescibacteria group bacterium]|nr:MAG: DNA helicase [Patescibacteria group bacterium]
MRSFLDDLNPIQREAVTTITGPVLILAGAGSGKTRALTYRTVYMITEVQIPPQRILMVTFTNKAAGEMKHRVQELLTNTHNQPPTLPFMGTFHSLCVRILRIDGKHLGINPNFTIYDSDDQKGIVAKILKSMDINTKKVSPSAIHAIISQCKNELISPEMYAKSAKGPYQEVVAKVFFEYENHLHASESLDFDDLLNKTVDLFQTHTDTLTKYQNIFQYLMVDEYQDTNRVQYTLTNLLAKAHRNLCVVGDMSQSIYKFRGADIRNIISFERDYPESKIFKLEENYRSTQMILNAANHIIRKNTGHQVLNLYTNKLGGNKIVLYEAQSEVDESHYIAQKILSENYLYKDVAILYRTNAQSRALEECFIHQSIPYKLIGGIRFYERKEIKDLIAYLRVIANPNDTASHERLEKMGKTRYRKFLNWAQDLTPMISPQPEDLFTTTTDEATKSSPNNYTTLELLEKTLEITSYLEYIDDGTEVAAGRIENIKELKTVATQYSNLRDFLEQISLVEGPNSTLQANGTENAVTMMTLHAAKGLEFKHVFIIGWEEGLFPHARSVLQKEEIEEERRLAYVGITRAMEDLFLCYAVSRMIYGSRNNTVVSRFIADIPEELLQFEKSYEHIRPTYSRRENWNDDIYW